MKKLLSLVLAALFCLSACALAEETPVTVKVGVVGSTNEQWTDVLVPKLAEEGIHVEVVDIRSLVPLDTKTIVESVKKTHRALIVHEAVQFGGFGGEIAGQIADSDAFYYLDAPIRRLGALSCPIPFNPNLERETFPTVDKIIAQVKSLL